jgi:hypothetical protein
VLGDVRFFPITFALNSPVFTISGLGNEIYAYIFSTYLMMKGTILPSPNMGESMIIDLVGLQEIDHEFLEAASFMTFGSCFVTVFS